MKELLAPAAMLAITVAYAVVRFRHADLTEPQFVIRFWPWYAGILGTLCVAAAVAVYRRGRKRQF